MEQQQENDCDGRVVYTEHLGHIRQTLFTEMGKDDVNGWEGVPA